MSANAAYSTLLIKAGGQSTRMTREMRDDLINAVADYIFDSPEGQELKDAILAEAFTHTNMKSGGVMIRVVNKATFIQLLSLNLIRPTASALARARPGLTVFAEWFRSVKSVGRKPQAQIAQDYEKDNMGLFRGVEERREEATVQELKRIITRFIGGRTTTRMTKAEAAAVVVIRCWRNINYSIFIFYP